MGGKKPEAGIGLWPIILEPIEGRKLRVGCCQLWPTTRRRFLLPILSNHNRQLIEVWALNTGSHDDWITDHIRKRVDHWVDLRFGTTTQCARKVAELKLDVLIELGGFTANSRLELLCHRPAPVQLSYLGYQDLHTYAALMAGLAIQFYLKH